VRLGLTHPASHARVADRNSGRLEAIADPSPDWAIFGTAGDASTWLEDRGHALAGWELYDLDAGRAVGPVGA
jgi:hypothetical protein